MLRGMVFVDHQNFIISLHSYYRKMGLPSPKLDYAILFRKITELVDNVDFVKTSMFVPKPDDFLMGHPMFASAYRWTMKLRNKPFLDVIEGRFISRPTRTWKEMDVNDKTTYYKEEKGSDINLAVDVVSKAFHNAYDVAFIVSADSDYLKVYNILRHLGKLTVVVVMSGQNVTNLRPHVDAVIELDTAFFDTCLLPETTEDIDDAEDATESIPENVDADATVIDDSIENISDEVDE